MKTHSRILISVVGALLLSLTAASASTAPIRPHWQTVFHASAPYGLSGLAIDQRGVSTNKWMYTANASTGYLLRFGTGGHYLGRWSYGVKATNPYVLSHVGIAVGGQGNVFVTDAARNRIEKFYPPYGLINQWGTAGSGPNQFNQPVGIAVDRQGNVYVADKLNLRIQKFSPAGTFLSMWPMPWRDGTGGSMPTSIAIGPRNTIYVTGTCSGHSCPVNTHFDSTDIVVRFSTTGQVLRDWVGGTPHDGVGPGDKPWLDLNAVVVDGAGNWYVAGLTAPPGASLNGVLEFSPAGTLLNSWSVPDAATLQGIASPQGIALGPKGSIYVTQGARILKLVR